MTLSDKTLEKLQRLINEESCYRSGKDLIKFFAAFGFNDSYGPGFGSRKDYTGSKLKFLNGTADIDKCIKKVLAPVEFIENIDKLDECIKSFNAYLAFDGWKVVRRNREITFTRADVDVDEMINEVAHNSARDSNEISLDSFLKKQFEDIDFSRIPIESALVPILNSRLDELKFCMKDAPLSAVILVGSILECVLLSVATHNRRAFESSSKSPRKQVEDWTLNDFIEVAHDLGYLKVDVHRFSDALRKFRNYIHPHRQLVEQFHPTKDTAHICFHVLKAAMAQINERGHAMPQHAEAL